ncbi:oligosaccharide flippase family protein [Desertivirga brevis]|uniref:oligosaccharide flippase family protein n=1 Tax=Desertivirga brevis TaxID=2810310 RepID=UPI0034E2769A
MINRYKSLITADSFQLYLSYIVNYLFPLLIVPIILRRVGLINFGLLGFSQVIVNYFSLIINYGFDISATREIAKLKDKEKVQDYISDILRLKIILFAACTTALVIYLLIAQYPKEVTMLYMFTYLINLGFLFTCNWYFLGTKKITYFTWINLTIKALVFLSIYLFVFSNTYSYYNLIFSFGQIIIGCLHLFLITREYKIDILPSIKNISTCYSQLAQSFPIFISTIITNIYTLSTVTVLGFVSGAQSVGIFSSASKLISAAITILYMPLNQFLLPELARAGEAEILPAIKKILSISLVLASLTSILFFASSELLMELLYGQNGLEGVMVIKVLSFLPLIISFSNAFGSLGLISLKKDWVYLKIISSACILSLILATVLSTYFTYVGASIAWVMVELVISALTTYYFITFYSKKYT